MRFSLIIPVLNEEAVLETQMQRLKKLCAQQDCEVLLVDGGSNDRSVSIAEQYGRVIHAPRGRARQMNVGAAAACGEVLLFVHADTQLPEQTFAAIEVALRSPEVVGGAFRLRFDQESWPYRAVAFVTNLRSRLWGSFTGDQAYFMRASVFQALGGYPEQPLMEDLEIITRLRRVGTVVLLPHTVITSARRHEKLGLARSVLFMWYLRTLYSCGVSARRLQHMYLDIR